MPSRARAPTRAPSVHAIGHLHLCGVTGSFADLSPREAEASSPPKAALLGAPWSSPGPPHLRCLREISPVPAVGASQEGIPGARATRAPPAARSEPGCGADTRRAPVVAHQPNSERPAPASAASDWLAGGGAIVRRPNRSSVSHGLPLPGPRGRRRRRPDSSHWQTASGFEPGRQSSAAAVGRAALQLRSSANALAPAAPGSRRPRIVPGPVAEIPDDRRGLMVAFQM
ncbi:uncharacterized protein LOC114676823 [Macaca mulatta]